MGRRLREDPGNLAVLLAFACFVGLGLPDGVLGVAWPGMRRSFDLPLDALGPLLAVHTTGYLMASSGSGGVLGRVGLGKALAGACLCFGIGLASYALAPAWWMLVSLVVFAGAGAGVVDVGLNTWVATRRGARALAWLHGCYGVGATAGPVLVSTILAAGLSWRLGYALLAGLQLLLALAFLATRRRFELARPPPGSGAPLRGALRRRAVWLGVVTFFVYTGAEVTAGAWAYSVLVESRGVAPSAAGATLALYWGAFTAGRFAFGAVANAVPLRRALRAALATGAFGAACFSADLGTAASAAGLGLLGLGLAPIYPLLIAATPRRVGATQAASAVGLQVAAGGLGAAALPALAGVVAAAAGLEAIGPFLLGATSVLAGLAELLARQRPPGAGGR
jgi:fucose permease